MKTNKTKFLAILIALSILLASIAFAEPKSQRYNQFYPSKSSLSGYATAIPPNTSITGNAIEVQPSTSSSPTFVVKETGYVGIGIPGPQSPLHVKTSAGQLKVSEAGANSVALTVRNNADTGHGSLALNASDYWWQTSGNTRMVLDDQGRLGVGTNSPSAPLHVKTSAGQLKVEPSGVSSVNLTVLNNAGDGYGWLGYSAAGHSWYATASQSEAMVLGSDGKLRINGDVGIGTAPLTNLQVHQTVDDANSWSVFRLTRASDPGSMDFAYYGGPSGGSGGLIQVNNGALRMYTGDSTNTLSERMRVNANGNVGIGTQTPQAKLHVNNFGDNIFFGAGNLPYPSAPINISYGAIVGRGASGDFRLDIQDWTGRVNYFWNAYANLTNDSTTNNVLTGVNRYVASGEPASRIYQGVYGPCDVSQSGCIGTGGADFAFFGAPVGNAGDKITWSQIGALASGSHVFFSPRGNGNDFFIKNDGKIGIGTNVPGALLHTLLPTSGSGDREVAKFGSNGGNPYITIGSGPGGYVLFDDINKVLRLDTHGFSEGLLVKNSDVGIGANPKAKLHVNGAVKLEGLPGSGKFLCIDDQNNVYKSSTTCQ